MKRRSFLCLALLGLIVGGITRAQEPVVKINLVAEDQFAIRSMKIFDTAGKKIPRIRTLDSFDPSAKTFSVTTVFERTKHFSLSDIDRIEFGQEIKKQQPFAQMARWTIEVTKDPVREILVPRDRLVVKDGILILKESVPVEEDLGGVWEALSIAFKAPEGTFLVKIQHVKYEKKFLGGEGGSSGMTKGVQ